MLEKLKYLQNRIKDLKSISLDEKLKLDQEIMEFQFTEVNDFFEALRNELEKVEVIVEEVKEESPS